MARLIKKAAYRAINRGAGQARTDWKALLAEVFEKTYEVGNARNPFFVDPEILDKIKEIKMDLSTLLKGRRKREGADNDD